MKSPFKLPVSFYQDKEGFFRIRDANNGLIAKDLSREEAEYIVRCINQHEKLLEALHKVLAMCDEICRADHEDRNSYYTAGEIGDVVREALTKAEKSDQSNEPID